MREVLRPRVYLIHRTAGWIKDFADREELDAYLRHNSFTQIRLTEYYVILGEGIWDEVLWTLPGPPPKLTAAECPF